MWRTALFGLTLVIVNSAGAAAQQVASLEAGARVRMGVGQKHNVVGTVIDVSADSVRIRTSAGLQSVSVGQIETLRFSEGRQGKGRSMLRKGGIGAGLGVLGGLILGIADGDDDPQAWFAMSAGEKAAVGGVFFGGLGLIVGSIVGLINEGERWGPVLQR